LVNKKPCCGEISVAQTTLQPGDETDVDVTISVRQEFGNIVHEAVVLTEPPQPKELVLRTTAKAYPRIRIEGAIPDNRYILLNSDGLKCVELSVFAYGSSAEPPADLDHVSLRSTIKVDWLGPKQSGNQDGVPRIECRRFAAMLDPGGSPGERTAEVLLLEREQVLYRYVVSWELASPITASPKVIVMKPGGRQYKALVQARDQKPFLITRVECVVPSIRGRATNNAAATSQVVEIDGGRDPRPPGSGRGVISVFTDHPDQRKVELPFIVLE
jgi:hypothetical protein